MTVSHVIRAGGENERRLWPQSKAGLLSSHQRPESIPELREDCLSPTLPQQAPALVPWGPGRSEATCQEAGSWMSLWGEASPGLCMPQSPGVSGSCWCFKAA